MTTKKLIVLLSRFRFRFHYVNIVGIRVEEEEEEKQTRFDCNFTCNLAFVLTCYRTFASVMVRAPVQMRVAWNRFLLQLSILA